MAAIALLLVGLPVTRSVGPVALSVWIAAALVVLLPGWAALRLMRLERHAGLSGALPCCFALGLAVWTPPLAFAFALHLPFGWALVLTMIATVAMLVPALRRPPAFEPVGREELAAGLIGSIGFGYLTWRLSTGVVGDALFHVGRMRKILHVDGLSLGSISSFAHGAPHAGYAFPLLHAAWAGVARVSGADPAEAFVYLAPLCGMAMILGIYALTVELTGWRVAGYLAAVPAAWDICTLINGLIMQINQPPPFAFYVITPAVLILFVASLRGALLGAWAAAAAVLALALVHPTYVVPVLAIMVGIMAGSWRAHLTVARSAVVAVAVSVLASSAVAVWIWWVAIRGGERRVVISHSDEFLNHGASAYLMYPWAPVYGRGYVLLSIVGLILLVRFRRTLPVAGAMLGMLALLLIPGLNTAIISGTGMAQFHRFWQVLPWPVALAAEACVLARLLGGRLSAAVSAALAALMLFLRGERYFWRWPTSALVGLGIVVAVAGLIREPRRHIESGPAWAAALLVAATLVGPIAYGGGTVLDEARAGPHRPARPDLVVELGNGPVAWFARHDRPMPVVLGEEHRLFELVGKVPVYAQSLPEARTRAEPKINTVGRRIDGERFFSPSAGVGERAEILKRWGVDYVLLDLQDQAGAAEGVLQQPGLSVVYRDPRWVILRVNEPSAARSSADTAEGSSSR
jgi:hypothetical protein